jgi:hypothetical protein
MKTSKLLAGSWITLGLLVCMSLLYGAGSAKAQSVVQSYSSTAPLQTGMIVRLVNDSTAAPATAATIGNMFGVVINPSEADVTLTSGSNPGQTYVTSNGLYNVLVSNQDGPIAVGDYVSISSIEGVGMKASTNESLIVGKAAGAFSGKTNVINTTSLTTSTGKKITVSLGEVPVSIAISRNPLVQVQTPDVPNFLERLAQTANQKPVAASRIYLSLVALLLTVMIITIMLYAAVRNSIVAVGRNPLSKHSITKSLWQVTGTCIIIFIVGLFAVYLLLKA